MKISTNVMVRKHIYWAEIANEAADVITLMVLSAAISMAVVDCFFPNTPM